MKRIDIEMRNRAIFPLICTFFAAATICFGGCGDEGGPGDESGGQDVLIVGDIDLTPDVAGDDESTEVNGDEGLDEGQIVACETSQDCPQPVNVCEHLSCHPTEKVCVQDNGANSGNLCDDGHACTSGDRCQYGVCVPADVICGECGDGACFHESETCRNCPDDCGLCPPEETDCQDGRDEDADGVTDCDDDECSSDARCFSWTCVSLNPDDTLDCGEAALDQPKGLRVNEPACGIEVGSRAWIYRFSSLGDRQVTVGVTPENAGESFRLFVMEGTCNPGTCIGVSASNGELSFEARRDWKYYILVEKLGSGTGGVTTSLNCQ